MRETKRGRNSEGHAESWRDGAKDEERIRERRTDRVKMRVCMCEHVSDRPIATGKPGMERVSMESGEGELLEDATGQLKAGNEGL